MTKFDIINSTLEKDGIAILPPMDVFESISLMHEINIHAKCIMLDPWYNKGIGGELPLSEYDLFISRLLSQCSTIGDLIYLWGFPEIVGPYVRYTPDNFTLTAWITWYYKNCPSVIRGWRSSQNACLQFSKNGCKLHPEHFLSPAQLEKYNEGKLRYIPGPPSVIEEPLIIGFVGKKERTGHPAQKPEAVFDKLLLMAAQENDIIFDPMAGSGTTAACALKHGMKCIVCDRNEEYVQLIEKRVGIRRVSF